MLSGLFTNQRVHAPPAVDPQSDTGGHGRAVQREHLM